MLLSEVFSSKVTGYRISFNAVDRKKIYTGLIYNIHKEETLEM